MPAGGAGARQVGEMAAAGDVEAIYELGRWRSNVNRIDPDMGHDIHSLAEAMRMGYAYAQFDLAVLYAKIDDLETAFGLFKRASEKGHPGSALQLGRYYFNDWGTDRDTVLAAHCLRKARDQGFLPVEEYLKEKDSQCDGV